MFAQWLFNSQPTLC